MLHQLRAFRKETNSFTSKATSKANKNCFSREKKRRDVLAHQGDIQTETTKALQTAHKTRSHFAPACDGRLGPPPSCSGPLQEQASGFAFAIPTTLVARWLHSPFVARYFGRSGLLPLSWRLSPTTKLLSGFRMLTSLCFSNSCSATFPTPRLRCPCKYLGKRRANPRPPAVVPICRSICCPLLLIGGIDEVAQQTFFTSSKCQFVQPFAD